MPSGEKNLENRWSIIEKSLLGNIKNSYQLEKAIKRYNSRYADQWDFSGLHSFFNDVADTAEKASFFHVTLPAMISLALRLPHIITHPIPLLLQQEQCLLTMSQLQVSCLVANAFFCTFPRRNAQKQTSEYGSFPTINFNTLFGGGFQGINAAQANKLRAVIHYFHRVTSNPPTGTLTFKRQVLKQNIPWDKCETTLSRLHVRSKGMIEDEGEGMLQVDFANKFVGGGVLGKARLIGLFIICVCLCIVGCDRGAYRKKSDFLFALS
jgi:poly(ADP-ribose) glycohydrolase